MTGNPFRYTGRRVDPETGLYYYRARYYSPKTGRFLQTDPIGAKDDLNLYAYVGNDPANQADPGGKCGPLCSGFGGFIAGGLIGFGTDFVVQWVQKGGIENIDFGQSERASIQGAIVGGLTGLGMGSVAGPAATKLAGGSLVAATSAGIIKAGQNVAAGRPVGEGVAEEAAYAAATVIVVGKAAGGVASALSGGEKAAAQMHFSPTPSATAEAVGAAAGYAAESAAGVAKSAAQSQPSNKSPAQPSIVREGSCVAGPGSRGCK